MSKVILDLDLLSANSLTPNEYCFLYCQSQSLDLSGFLAMPVDLARLEFLGFIKDTEGQVILRSKAIKLLERGVIPQNSDVSDWIDEFRSLFKGKKIGAMGDRKACVKKMAKFLEEYPEATKEKILISTERYINSERKNNYMYLQRADYFISKQDKGKDDSSRLAIMLEEIDSLEEQGVASVNIEDDSTNTFIRDI
jgi:hypothetical protein